MSINNDKDECINSDEDFMPYLSEIEDIFDLSRVSYSDYINIISCFFDKLFEQGGALDKYSVSDDVKLKISLYLNAIRDNANNKCDLENLKYLRIDAWKEFDKTNGYDKLIIRLIVIGLYDEDSSEYSPKDSDSFELIFGLLDDISTKLCWDFADFLRHNPIMQHHRLSEPGAANRSGLR